MVLAYNTNVGGGLASGVDKIAGAFLKNRTNQGLASGLSQIQNGDWNGGINAIAQYDPQQAMAIFQKRQERQNAVDDAQADRDFRTKFLDQQFQNAKDLANLQNQKAMALADYKNNLTQNKEDEAQSIKNAQDAVNLLYDISSKKDIGALTRQRQKFGVATDEQEKQLGQISGAIAAIAPRAISKLKAAGVSGVNTLGEFMTYVGLPENATAMQISGALPMIAQIAGVQMPQNAAPAIQEAEPTQEAEQTHDAGQTQARGIFSWFQPQAKSDKKNYRAKYGLE